MLTADTWQLFHPLLGFPVQSRDQSSRTTLIRFLWQHDSRYSLGSANLGEFGRQKTEADYPTTGSDRQTSELGSHKLYSGPWIFPPEISTFMLQVLCVFLSRQKQQFPDSLKICSKQKISDSFF